MRGERDNLDVAEPLKVRARKTWCSSLRTIGQVKRELRYHFVEAVRRVANGGSWLDPLVVERMVNRRRDAGPVDHLTPREREVALLVVDGHSDREIAQRLHLSHHTVSQYVKRIYRKLDVASRVALTRLLLDLRDSGRRG